MSKTKILASAVLFAALLCAGCEADTYELLKVANDCNGIDKVHSLWFDGSSVKAYCLDGSRA